MGLFGGSKTQLAVSLDRDTVTCGDSVRARIEVGEPDAKAQGGSVELMYLNTFLVPSDKGMSSASRTSSWRRSRSFPGACRQLARSLSPSTCPRTGPAAMTEPSRGACGRRSTGAGAATPVPKHR